MAENLEGMFVSQVRDFTVRTNMGHVLHFKKGVPKYVPPEVRELMAEHAIMPVEGDIPVKEEVKIVEAPQGDDRREKIFQAVQMIADMQESDDFTGGGMPKIEAISRVAGFTVDGREREAAWTRHLQEAAA